MRALGLAVLLLATAAHAEPPPGTRTDTPEAAWYRGLTQPGTGWGCCSIADCRPVEWRTTPSGGYAVLISTAAFGKGGDDAWHDVPAQNVIRDKPNPTGEAVACWYARQVRCFVLPDLT